MLLMLGGKEPPKCTLPAAVTLVREGPICLSITVRVKWALTMSGDVGQAGCVQSVCEMKYSPSPTFSQRVRVMISRF